MMYYCEACGVFGEGHACWVCGRRESLQWGRVWDKGVESHVLRIDAEYEESDAR